METSTNRQALVPWSGRSLDETCHKSPGLKKAFISFLLDVDRLLEVIRDHTDFLSGSLCLACREWWVSQVDKRTSDMQYPLWETCVSTVRQKERISLAFSSSSSNLNGRLTLSAFIFPCSNFFSLLSWKAGLLEGSLAFLVGSCVYLFRLHVSLMSSRTRPLLDLQFYFQWNWR